MEQLGQALERDWRRWLTGIKIAGPDKPPEPTCQVCGGAGWLRIDAKLGSPDFGKVVRCFCNVSYLAKQSQNDNALGFRGLEAVSLDTIRPLSHQTEALEAVLGWVSKRGEKWVYLAGVPGCGKTELAALAINLLRLEQERAIFCNVIALLAHLRGLIGGDRTETIEEFMLGLVGADWLVIDDLGAETGTPWQLQQLYELINARYSRRLPTLLTSNDAPHDYKDDRLASRLSDIRLVHLVNMPSIDVRRYKLGE